MTHFCRTWINLCIWCAQGTKAVDLLAAKQASWNHRTLQANNSVLHWIEMLKLHPWKITKPLKIGNPKRKLILQTSFFRCYVKYRGCSFLGSIKQSYTGENQTQKCTTVEILSPGTQDPHQPHPQKLRWPLKMLSRSLETALITNHDVGAPS